MFTRPVGPFEVFFYWPETVFGNFYWPGAIGAPLASSPVSSNGPKKNRVGRSVKTFIFGQFFWSFKMCVLCMFYVDWELGGQKKLQGRDFF